MLGTHARPPKLRGANDRRRVHCLFCAPLDKSSTLESGERGNVVNDAAAEREERSRALTETTQQQQQQPGEAGEAAQGHSAPSGPSSWAYARRARRTLSLTDIKSLHRGPRPVSPTD
jgi:hypothetical protein